MAYVKPTISGYNSVAPSDDGSNTAANEVKWAAHKDKLGDPLKNYIDAVNNEVFDEKLDSSGGTMTGLLTIDQDVNLISLKIDSEATTADIINIQATVLTAGSVIDVGDADALTTGSILNLVSNSADTSGRNLISLTNDNVSATGTRVLRVQQDSTGICILVDQNGNGIGLSLDTEATSANGITINPTVMTTGNVIDIPDADALTTGSILNLVSNSADTGARTLVQITNDNTAATGTTSLEVKQDSTGNGIFINQDGNGVALNIESESVSSHCVVIDCAQQTQGNGLIVNDAIGGATNSRTTGNLVTFSSTSTDTGSREVLQINQLSPSATGMRGFQVVQTSSAEAVLITKGTTDGGMINFEATADGDTTSAISTLTTSGATTHHVQVEINGAKGWVAVSTNVPS